MSFLSARPAAANLLTLLFLLLAGTTSAQDAAPGSEHGVESIPPSVPATPDWYYERAQTAIEAENYETAVRILQEGQRRYPAVGSLNMLLADLYYDKELYALALEEYLETVRKDGEDFLVLNQIARCYGKLNREQDSITTLERILELYPESVSAVDDLGWMYFKTHQLEKGEALLLEALDGFGPERGLYMTLGTIYSGMYDFENSRRFYLLAIDHALKEDDDYFASVAYYNLSLLEHNFYRFNSALRHTEESIRLSDRAPGHLARGELFQSRLDFRRALEEYEQASARDTTPLSKVNLAMLYQRFGYLELARRYAEEVISAQDRAWMYYFGTDVTQHLKDIHEILWKVYAGLARAELRKPSGGPLGRLVLAVRSLRQRVLAYYHRQKYRSLALRVGHSNRDQNNLLDAYWEFFKAAEGYERVALKYLRLAREIEIPISPQAEASYLFEEGRLRSERALLEEAINAFDPFWEREGIHDALAALVPLLPRGGKERREALNRLFSLNPGALPQQGLRLPLSVTPAPGSGRSLRRVLRKLDSAVARSGGSLEEGVRYSLTVERTGPELVTARVTDRATDEMLFQESFVTERSLRSRAAAAVAAKIAERLYSVR
jgi:tetratricopeptide (TPR) repeat protein